MPTIVIKRSSEYVNKLRVIDLYLDDKKLGNITDGEEQTFEVPSGEHRLKAKIDWCGSPELSFRLADEEEQCFQLSSFQKIQRFIMLLFVLGAALLVTYVFVRNVLLMNIAVGLFATSLLLIAYMLTINRNRYLTLKKLGN